MFCVVSCSSSIKPYVQGKLRHVSSRFKNLNNMVQAGSNIAIVMSDDAIV
jgi:hypothetical protein